MSVDDVLSGLDPNELLARGMMSEVESGSFTGWVPPEVEELERIISGYEVRSMLGRGGMGAVYQVYNEDLDRLCALKLLPLEVSVEPGFDERFIQEARAMAKLDHSNIVTIYDFGRTSEGHLFYVMEFIDGLDLAALIKAGELGVGKALDIVMQVCDALEYAHKCGYVHRDVKPANILVDKHGSAKVTDFGLAKILNREVKHSMTMTGQVMGSPDYMAPEQSTGQDVDHRADIYALGVMLYEMLTGTLPKGVFEPPSKKVEVDVKYDEVVIKAMQQQPELRYQRVCDVKTSIEGAADSDEEQEENEQSNLMSLVVVVLCLLLAMFAGWRFFGGVDDVSGDVDSNDVSLVVDNSKWPKERSAFINSQGRDFVPVSGTDVLVSVTEARRSDWDQFLSETGYEWEAPGFNTVGDAPALNISWNDANTYCEWLTSKERDAGLLGPEMEYRLPTDLEWSAAVGLGKEAGNDPKARSGKIKGVFPWGNDLPAPEELKGELDGGDYVVVAQAISKGTKLFSLVPSNKTEYWGFTRYIWNNVRGKVQDSHGLYAHAEGITRVVSKDKANFFHYGDKTYLVVPHGMMGHVCRDIVRQCGWKFADWSDASFREAVIGGATSIPKNNKYWVGARWKQGKWKYEEKEYQRDLFLSDDSYKRNEELVVNVLEDGLIFESSKSSYGNARLKAVLVFEGVLDEEQVSAIELKAYSDYRTKWRYRVVEIINKSFPELANEWQEKILPVDDLWVNDMGIKGLAGGAREWVIDEYSIGSDRKALRGGGYRTEAWGPDVADLTEEGDDKLEVFMKKIISQEQAYLSSHRGVLAPDIRKSWIGFRPVLAFK